MDRDIVQTRPFLDLTLPDAVGRNLAAAGTVRYRVLARLVRIARGLAWGVLLACILIAAGYVFDLWFLFRPIAGGPATSPLTVLIVALLAICQILYRQSRPLSAGVDTMLGVVVLLCLFRSAEILLGEDVLTISPLLDSFIPASDFGAVPRTGSNTIFVALILAVGFLGRKRAPRLGMIMAVTGPIIPMVSLIGYLFGLDSFYGEMSLITVFLTLSLGFAMFVNYAHKRLFRPIVADTALGRIARLQLVASLTLPLGLGMVLIRVPGVIHSVWIAFYIAMMIWFVVALVVLAARAHDMTDQQRRQIERRLVSLSMRDALTGVVNRQGVADALPLLDKSSLGVILLDLDFFKQVNDTYGHAAGDAILQQTGAVLRSRMRPDDIVARWGGEEFLVLAPDLTAEDLPTICEDLRRRISGLTPESGAELTASVGATIMNDKVEELEEALARADTGLYMAKSRGRNMVVVRERPGNPALTKPGNGRSADMIPQVRTN